MRKSTDCERLRAAIKRERTAAQHALKLEKRTDQLAKQEMSLCREESTSVSAIPNPKKPATTGKRSTTGA